MSDSGASPPENGNSPPNESSGSSNSRRRNNGRSNKKKNRQNNNANSSSFKGPLVGYENYVYDVNKNSSGADAFNTTTIRLSEYISRTVSHAGEFMNAMNPDNLGFVPIVEPPDTVATTGVAYEKWKTLHRNWDMKTQRRDEGSKAAFAIIMGQCSDSLKDKMRTYDEWENIQANLTIIALLELIRTAMYSGTATSKSTLTSIEAELGLLNCKQSKKMSNSKYLEVFRNRVEVFILLGGEPGTWTSRVNAVLATDDVDAQAPTDDEKTAAAEKAREEYLAVLFINNCDASKYGKRVLDLKVKYVEGAGSDPYPTTLARALEMLETWDEVFRRSKRNRSTTDESGIAYATTDEDPNNRSHIQGNTGRGRGGRGGGRGRGYGRGGRGHQGRGRGNGRNECEGDEAHHINHDDADNEGIFEQDDGSDNYINDNYINQQFNP